MILRFGLTFFMLGIFSCQWAQLIRVGSFRFDVEAHNQWGREIQFFTGSGRIDGHLAFIGIRAPGYRPTHVSVQLMENQLLYPVRIEMKDPLVKVSLKTKQGDEIESDFFVLNELSNSEEYVFETEIKSWGFSDFTPWQVDIRINKRVLERAFVALRGYGYGRIIEINFPRNNLQEYQNEIEIVIPKDGLKSTVDPKGRRQRQFQMMHRLTSESKN